MSETIGRYRPQARSRSESSKSSLGRAKAVMLDVMKPDGLVPGVGAAAPGSSAYHIVLPEPLACTFCKGNSR